MIVNVLNVSSRPPIPNFKTTNALKIINSILKLIAVKVIGMKHITSLHSIANTMYETFFYNKFKLFGTGHTTL